MGRAARIKARRKARRDGTDTKPRCPAPRKLSFTSQEHAEKILRFWNYDNRDKKPTHAYECICGSWHHTSKGLNP